MGVTPNRLGRDLRWNPTTVSWASFLLFSLVVSAIGLWGSQRIAQLLEREMVFQGIDHNRAVFRSILPRMYALLARYPQRAGVLRAFPKTFGAAETLSMSVFLIDRRRHRVIAHTGYPISEDGLPLHALLGEHPRPTPLLPEDDPHRGEAMAVTARDGERLLWYRAPIPILDGGRSYARNWDLVVETEMMDLANPSARLQRRVRWLLVTTDLLIVLFGFLALRRVGRRYERVLERELAARTAELETSYAQVLQQTTLATIGRTASILAHEMRNPLAAIKLSLSSLARSDALRERDRRRVELVLQETDRLNALLSRTLDQVRPIRRSREPVALDPLVERVLALLQPVAEAQNLRISWNACSDCPALRVDVDQVQQALLNLVKNALAFSPSGETVCLNTEAWQGGWRVQVTNRGEPIAPEDRERIFEAFYSTRPKGTGLGLFLVRRVVREHGGEITLESDAQAGTRFTLWIPPDSP